jgi:DNA-binding CsgD family transcriptional regulator
MTQKYIKEWVASQDWSKSDAEIASITRVAYQTVRARRITAGIFRRSEPPEWTLDQDWSLCDAEIARQRGMAYHKVRNLRMSLNIPPGAIGKQSGPTAIARLTKVDKHSIDWTINDATIARTHGISRERARQLRKELNAPKSPFYNKQTK